MHGLSEAVKQTFALTKQLGELLGNDHPLCEYAVFLAVLLNYYAVDINKYSLTFPEKICAFLYGVKDKTNHLKNHW